MLYLKLEFYTVFFLFRIRRFTLEIIFGGIFKNETNDADFRAEVKYDEYYLIEIYLFRAKSIYDDFFSRWTSLMKY